MKKIPCLFQRDHSVGSHNTLVRDEVTPGCEWVINGEGIATLKWDGSGCLIRDGCLYKRYEVKKGKKPPADFEPACEVDPNTGKQQGWRPVGDGPEDKWFREAFDWQVEYSLIDDGTYELIGPKVQGNRENYTQHRLIRHGKLVLAGIMNMQEDEGLTFDGLSYYLQRRDIEGIVWWHPDGRMVKLRKADFGIPRVAGGRVE